MAVCYECGRDLTRLDFADVSVCSGCGRVVGAREPVRVDDWMLKAVGIVCLWIGLTIAAGVLLRIILFSEGAAL